MQAEPVTNPRIILLNGPPYCGKDTLARVVHSILMYRLNTYAETKSVIFAPIAHPLRFAEPLKRSVAAAFNLSPEERQYFFETSAKDVASPVFFGHTPRAVLIDWSENWAKGLFGDRVFGLWAKQEMERRMAEGTRYFIFSDSGFATESQVLLDAYGPEAILLIQIHRQSCTFEGDSRSWLTLPFVDTWVYTNERNLPGEAPQLEQDLCDIVQAMWPDLQPYGDRPSIET